MSRSGRYPDFPDSGGRLFRCGRWGILADAGMTRRGSDVSVYKVVEIIGPSTESWEDAGLTAVKKARETIRNLRVAEVLEQDLDLDDSGGATFRTKLRVSFKFEDEA